MRPARRARAIVLAGAFGVSIVGGACGGDSDTDTSARKQAAPAGGGTSITIKDFAFSPEPLEVPKGTVVKVTNADDAVHTATAEGDEFDTGNLAKGESKEITLSEAGEIAYICNIHDYMRGVIQVTA